MTSGSGGKWVAGVDGCPGGWVIVLVENESMQEASVRLVQSFQDVLGLDPAPQMIAVDIPIGLPERGGRGGRRSDIEARSRLGARQSAVFAVPARAAVMEDDYGRACTVALENSDPPLKVSKQTFNLFPKIREVDRAMSPKLQERIVECHPELAFWALNGEQPLAEPKKVKSKLFEPGLEFRRALLMAAGFNKHFVSQNPFPKRLCGPDDLLDAAACAWSAWRIFRGQGQRFPEEPEQDGMGLRMEIWC